MKRAQLIAEIADDLSAFKRVVMASHSHKWGSRMPTMAQIGILALIAHEGPQNLKDLAKQLCVSSSAATQLIDGLVKDRLLTRTEDADDRRRILLTLTAVGKRTMDAAKKRHVIAFTKLVAPLTDSELTEWKRLQRKIIEHAA